MIIGHRCKKLLVAQMMIALAFGGGGVLNLGEAGTFAVLATSEQQSLEDALTAVIITFQFKNFDQVMTPHKARQFAKEIITLVDKDGGYNAQIHDIEIAQYFVQQQVYANMNGLDRMSEAFVKFIQEDTQASSGKSQTMFKLDYAELENQLREKLTASIRNNFEQIDQVDPTIKHEVPEEIVESVVTEIMNEVIWKNGKLSEGIPWYGDTPLNFIMSNNRLWDKTTTNGWGEIYSSINYYAKYKKSFEMDPNQYKEEYARKWLDEKIIENGKYKGGRVTSQISNALVTELLELAQTKYIAISWNKDTRQAFSDEIRNVFDKMDVTISDTPLSNIIRRILENYINWYRIEL